LFKERTEIKTSLLSLCKFNVVKFKRILQSSFYLLGYTREQICEVNSNRLFWKKAKELFDDSFIEKMVTYNPIGERPAKFELYQTLNFIESNLEGILVEELDAYHHGISRLFKWLNLAI
jgi:hypothetical protein